MSVDTISARECYNKHSTNHPTYVSFDDFTTQLHKVIGYHPMDKLPVHLCKSMFSSKPPWKKDDVYYGGASKPMYTKTTKKDSKHRIIYIDHQGRKKVRCLDPLTKTMVYKNPSK